MLTVCLVNAISPEDIGKAEPVKGVPSLLRVLKDPYVAKGLGILLQLAGSLGRCAEKQRRNSRPLRASGEKA
ncbi:DUF1641 domain-containing protein [Hyperthermus butylicus]|uniref:DUF1641 domain-containing protein n=1 Tax=Hyperthermus butylicus TaxID=54248 RepID=UPI000326BFB3|nr:DUF1641 domain-containing protein [Hyperthermus butylicus]